MCYEWRACSHPRSGSDIFPLDANVKSTPLPRRRILFVDDEVRVLEGLKRTLRPLRNEWEIQTAEGAAQGLEILAAGPIDVVVSDMRMPGMDGADFLREVMRRHPRTVRIILSGQSDHESTLRAWEATHRFLPKPCDVDSLRDAVAQACVLRDRIADPALQAMVAVLGTLPSLPGSLRDLHQELGRAQPDLDRLGGIVERDPGLSTKILQVVNAARFGLQRTISTPAEAIHLLGIEKVRALAIGAHLFQEFAAPAIPGLDVEALWGRGLTIAGVAREIAAALGLHPRSIDLAFTAGLLHEAGLLLLVAKEPVRIGEALALATGQGLIPAERTVFGTDHGILGAYWLGLWGLPDPIVEAIAFVREPPSGPAADLSPAVAVHLARALVDEQGSALPGDRVEADARTLSAHALGGRLDELRALAMAYR